MKFDDYRDAATAVAAAEKRLRIASDKLVDAQAAAREADSALRSANDHLAEVVKDHIRKLAPSRA
jgi:hypothetical protein